jgi:hypothetical protein
MQVAISTLRPALLKAFMDSGARGGSWLAYSELATAWQRSGLRADDLRDAVHQMLEGGELLTSDRGGVLSLALGSGVLESLAHPGLELRLATLQDEDE